MSFDVHAESEGAAAPAAAAAGAAGKSALTDSAPAGEGSAATGKAEYGGGEARAHVGSLAEGSHPGVKKGGPGKKMLGNIVGGTFVRTAAAGGAAAAPAAGAAATATAGAPAAHDGERAYVANTNTADRTTNDGTTSVRMEDENESQAAMISAAVTRARELLDNAIGKLGSPGDAAVQRALQNNFHSTEAKVSSEVLSKLQRIRAAFNGTIPIEVESDGDARAYVYVIWSDIHLCPPWFADGDPDGRARTIIHECSHKYTGTDDEAYHWDSAKYAGLSVKDALDNADSYAWFCIDVR